ncbi:adenosylcobinamide-phosphate synthase CbiB [Synergistes jonesii]|uniref:adenosylcobinamide-phosphate synthase CbiB n=1 Tax=Synergistes jonesii TaxID=2754 RepID=UPI00331C704E
MRILAALLLDAIFGDPRRLPHPVVFVGRLISFCEKIFYTRGNNAKEKGFLFCAAVTLATAAALFVILGAAGLISPWLRSALEIYLIYAAIAFKSLKDESLPVARALASGELERARRQLGRIVGRDTERLDEAGVVRACVETIAESYVDGVVSVLFWASVGAFFGQAALFAWIFKASNTMDSMVGYDDERYRDFGYAAAKFDDAMNFLPARLGAAAAIVGGAIAGMDYRRAWRIFLRDRLEHKSPNSAHAESVFAGLLGIRLGGGAYYGDEWEARPFLGDDLRSPEPNDILRAQHILNLSVAVCAFATLALARWGA